MKLLYILIILSVLQSSAQAYSSGNTTIIRKNRGSHKRPALLDRKFVFMDDSKAAFRKNSTVNSNKQQNIYNPNNNSQGLNSLSTPLQKAKSTPRPIVTSTPPSKNKAHSKVRTNGNYSRVRATNQAMTGKRYNNLAANTPKDQYNEADWDDFVQEVETEYSSKASVQAKIIEKQKSR